MFLIIYTYIINLSKLNYVILFFIFSKFILWFYIIIKFIIYYYRLLYDSNWKMGQYRNLGPTHHPRFLISKLRPLCCVWRNWQIHLYICFFFSFFFLKLWGRCWIINTLQSSFHMLFFQSWKGNLTGFFSFFHFFLRLSFTNYDIILPNLRKKKNHLVTNVKKSLKKYF